VLPVSSAAFLLFILIAFLCRYVGIIDFLQQWNLQKRAERNWKVGLPVDLNAVAQYLFTFTHRFTCAGSTLMVFLLW
jgi:hypothetical protein